MFELIHFVLQIHKSILCIYVTKITIKEIQRKILNIYVSFSFQDSGFQIPSFTVEMSNKEDARKFTNDLMIGIFSKEEMLTHSVSGKAGNSTLEAKPALPAAKTNAIIGELYLRSLILLSAHAGLACTTFIEKGFLYYYELRDSHGQFDKILKPNSLVSI